MVVILNHAITAAILYYIDKDRFRISPENHAGQSDMMGISEQVQDAILKLSAVNHYELLESTVREALLLMLPAANDVVVYLQNADGRDLVSSSGLRHNIPKEGLASKALETRERIQCNGLDDADPLSGLLQTGQHPLPFWRKRLLCCGAGWAIKRKTHVYISPVEDKESERIIAVLVVHCEELTKEDFQNLSFLEKQLCVCFKRLRQQTSPTITPSHIKLKSCPDEMPSILNLCGDLYDEDAAKLQLKVIRYLQTQTDAQAGLLLLVPPEHRELVCQVIGDRILDEEIRFPNDGSSFSQVVESKNSVTLESVSKDHCETLQEHLGFKINSMLCFPVISKVKHHVVAVACMINKKNANQFTDGDCERIRYCFEYTAAVLTSTLAVQNEIRLKKQTQTMLQVAKNLFSQLDDLTMLLREIMQEARNLTKAERCSVFLIDESSNELVAKVFDGDIRNVQEVPKMTTEIRIPADQGIAGHVATTGEILNIDDAYSHPLFYRGVDETTGFRTRNILCFPIKDENSKTIGVAQLCNKIGGIGFSLFDVEVAQAFSVYCCISIVHSLMYQRVRDAQLRSKLSNELMIYHMRVSRDEVKDLARQEIVKVETFDPRFGEFSYVPRALEYDKTPRAVLSMLEEMDFINKYRIHHDTLSRFILMVRRGYRDPPYHNWAHAFAVAHFCYLLFRNANLLSYVDEIEVFSLFIACLCHDIDHRGTTNSYHVQENSPLAALYSSEGSVLERHHFAQTMCILNTDGCNIFENMNSQDYCKVLDLMRDIILATDLAHHLRILKDIEAMTNGYDKKNARHRMLLLYLMMTSCDLSDQTKGWKNTKLIAKLIYQEFFSQGDLEKALGHDVTEMMDRERAYIPELQLGFLDHIALPVFRMLVNVFEEAQVVVDAVQENRRRWVRMNEKAQEIGGAQISSMGIFSFVLDDEDES